MKSTIPNNPEQSQMAQKKRWKFQRLNGNGTDIYTLGLL